MKLYRFKNQDSFIYKQFYRFRIAKSMKEFDISEEMILMLEKDLYMRIYKNIQNDNLVMGIVGASEVVFNSESDKTLFKLKYGL